MGARGRPLEEIMFKLSPEKDGKEWLCEELGVCLDARNENATAPRSGRVCTFEEQKGGLCG